MKFIHPEGATLLSPEEIHNLIPKYLSTQSELNVLEAANIFAGKLWLSRRRKKDLLTLKFTIDLHKYMFNKVWRWAGEYRTLQTNIGIEPYKIPIELAQLLNDVYYQIDKTVYPMDEIAVRLHQRLTFIHPFPNGNGRHARLMTDCILKSYQQPSFTWGKGTLIKAGELRREYIAALKEADKHNFQPLLKFVRS